MAVKLCNVADQVGQKRSSNIQGYIVIRYLVSHFKHINGNSFCFFAV